MKKILLSLLIAFIAITLPFDNARAGTIYNITTGNDDFYSEQPDGGGITYYYTSTLLQIIRNNVVSPASTSNAYIKINTAGIPDGDTITAATLWIYEHSYTATKGITKTFNIYMPAISFIVYNKTYAGGWTSEVLDATEMAAINKTGTTDFTVTVSDPGAAKTRSMAVRAYEYDTPSTFSAYLDVTHAAPSTRGRIFLISLMNFKLEEQLYV